MDPAFDEERVGDYPSSQTRQGLYRELTANGYTVVGIVCSAEPIMTKWKWMIAARLPAKVFILNENGDYFWLDRGHWSSIRHFALFRSGLSGAGAVRTLAGGSGSAWAALCLRARR